MAKNANLTQAKRAKNDEFYTQYADIEKEVSAYVEYNPDVFKNKTILCPCDDYEWSNFTKYFTDNFKKFGLKKLISTCYDNSGLLFGARGKVQIVTKDGCENGLLEGNGDFRSNEVQKLFQEADIIITNPPFSLFREFMASLVEGKKKFAVIGNMNAIVYKEIFPLIKYNCVWLGATGNGSDMVFEVPQGTKIAEADREKTIKLGYIGNYTRLGNSCWLTNIEHSYRHKPLKLMTMADNIKHSKHKAIKGQEYKHYDNYDVIEVPFVDAIPSDYSGVMGVPISFLNKYCPEQFEIIWITARGGDGYLEYFKKKHTRFDTVVIGGKGLYQRIFIQRKQPLLTK